MARRRGTPPLCWGENEQRKRSTGGFDVVNGRGFKSESWEIKWENKAVVSKGLV
jgi:hypothetical protein